MHANPKGGGTGTMFDPAWEQLPREHLHRLQLDRLRAVVHRVEQRVPFYRAALTTAGMSAEAIRTLADLQRLPFTTKADLLSEYPLGLFAIPFPEVARVHATSGTRGKPVLVGYSSGDLQTWAHLCARPLAAAGGQPGDTVHIALNYGLFTGGLGVHGGRKCLAAR